MLGQPILLSMGTVIESPKGKLRQAGLSNMHAL